MTTGSLKVSTSSFTIVESSIGNSAPSSVLPLNLEIQNHKIECENTTRLVNHNIYEPVRDNHLNAVVSSSTANDDYKSLNQDLDSDIHEEILTAPNQVILANVNSGSAEQSPKEIYSNQVSVTSMLTEDNVQIGQYGDKHALTDTDTQGDCPRSLFMIGLKRGVQESNVPVNTSAKKRRIHQELELLDEGSHESLEIQQSDVEKQYMNLIGTINSRRNYKQDFEVHVLKNNGNKEDNQSKSDNDSEDYSDTRKVSEGSENKNIYSDGKVDGKVDVEEDIEDDDGEYNDGEDNDEGEEHGEYYTEDGDESYLFYNSFSDESDDYILVPPSPIYRSNPLPKDSYPSKPLLKKQSPDFFNIDASSVVKEITTRLGFYTLDELKEKLTKKNIVVNFNINEDDVDSAAKDDTKDESYGSDIDHTLDDQAYEQFESVVSRRRSRLKGLQNSQKSVKWAPVLEW